MRRFSSRRRMRPRTNFARARRVVQQVSGIVIAKRVNVVKFTVNDVTSADFDNPVTFDLLACTEANDPQIESTGGTTAGTDVATCPVHSKIIGIKLHTMVHGSSAGGEILRWAILKNPDNDITTANANTDWHNSDENTEAREVRANQLAKGQLIVSPNNLQTPLKLFIKRQTLRRLGTMTEADRIKFVCSKDATGTTLQVTMWGTIYIRANA